MGREAEAERNDRLVLEAARDVFSELGYDAPVSAIAERAGVGMGTLYRRYGSKEELLQCLCLGSMRRSIASVEEALASDGDGWSALAGYVRRGVAQRVGAFAPAAGRIAVTAEMTAASERGRELLERLVERGRADGSVRPDVTWIDVSYLIEQFSRGIAVEGQDEIRERLLALALDGLRNHGQEPLPGEPPTWESYRARWYPQ